MVHLGKEEGEAVTPDRELYQDFADAIGSAIVVINAEREIRYMNEAARRAWGDGEGEQCHHLLRQKRSVCPDCPIDDDLKRTIVARRRMQMPSRGGMSERENLYLNLGDPTLPLKYVTVVSTDIDERDRLEREFLREKELVKTLLLSVNTFVFGLDKLGNVTFVNRAGEAISGYSEQEIIEGGGLKMMTPEESLPLVSGLMSSIMEAAQKPEPFEIPLVTRSGESRTISWTYSPLLGAAGDVEGSVCLGQDVTERIKTGERAEERARELEVVNAILYMAGASTDVEEMLEVALGALLALPDYSCGAAYMVEEGGGARRATYGGPGNPTPEFIGTEEELFPAIALRSGEIETASGPGGMQSFALEMLEQKGLEGLVAVPLLPRKRPLGFLLLGHGIQPEDVPDGLEMLRAASEALVLGAENAFLRKQAESRAREATALLQVSQSLTVVADLDDALQDVVREAAVLLEADMCSIFLYDDETGLLHPRAGYGWDWKALSPASVPISESGTAMEAKETLKPVVVEDTTSDDRVPEFVIKDHGVKSSVAVPLVMENRFIGILFIDMRGSRRKFTPRDIELIESFAGHTATAIDKASLLETLTESEEKYRALVDSSLFGVFVHDGKNLLYVNERALEISGHGRNRFRTMQDVFDILVPEERQRVAEYATRRLKGEDVPKIYDTRIIRGDGSLAEVQLMNTLIRLKGKQVAMVTVSDITDRVRAEETVKSSEERYRTLVESSQDAIVIADPRGEILFANTASQKLTGLPAEELLGKSLYEFVHPKDREKVSDEFLRGWESGRGVDRYPVRVLVDGEERYFETTSAVLGEAGPTSNAMVIIRDVTERERVQRKLRESEEKYRTIVENSHDLIVMTNSAGEVLFVNATVEGIFGYRPDQVLGANVFKFVHPDERERIAKDFAREWKTGQAIPNYPVRCVKRDGSVIDVEATSGLVGWPREEAVQISVIRDVTERRRHERERELQLKVEEALAAVTSRFVEPGDIDAAIKEVLGGTGELLEVSRAYYVELSGDTRAVSKVLEWAAEETPSFERELKKVNLGEHDWWISTMADRREIVCNDTQDIASVAERKLFAEHSVASVVLVPVFVGDRFTGFIGYDSIDKGREWSVHEVNLLRDMTSIISRAIERKEWLEELSRSERFRVRITENIAEGLMVLRNGVITWVNRQACEIHGYEPDEMIGQNPDFLMPEKETAEEYAWRLLDALDETGRYVSEEKAVRKDGEIIDVTLAVAPLETEEEGFVELVVAVRDITSAKKMREEVTAAAEAYSTLFSAAGDALLVHTTDGDISDANERASLYTGYSGEELVGMNVVDLVFERDRPYFPDRQAEFGRDGHTSFETRLLRKDGSDMPVEISSKLTKIWGEGVVLSSLRDVTERKKADREIKRRAMQLASLNEIVKASTSSLDLDTVVDAILGTTIDVTGATSGTVVLETRPGRGEYRVLASKGHSPEYVSWIDEDARRRILLDIIASSEGSVVLDMGVIGSEESFSEVSKGLRSEGTVEVLFIPLKSGDRTMGVMELSSDTRNVFEPRDKDFYDAAGAEIGVSIENALIYRELAAEHERLSLLYRSAQSISGELELWSLLNTTLAEAARIVGAESALIGLLESGSEEFNWSASFNIDLEGIENLRMSPASGISSKIIEEKRAVVASREGGDLERIEEDPVASRLDVYDVTAVPLISGDRVVGVMHLHNIRGSRRPSAEDILLLEAIGRQAGVAIENARLYEETRRHLLALEKAHEELMTLDRMKSDFVSTVSHELRSPLAVIEGFARTLVEHFDQIDRGTERESIEIILKKAISLEGLIGNILDMARIEEGRLEVNVETFDIVALCERVRSDQERVVEMHDLELESREREVLVAADREKTEVAVGNLVRNAIKFSPEGGKVVIRVEETDGQAEVSVEDHGIGISPQHVPRVFDRFFQVDSGETRSFSGTGLGLYITRELLTAMGGQIFIESEPGLGSTFRFTLPLAD